MVIFAKEKRHRKRIGTTKQCWIDRKETMGNIYLERKFVRNQESKKQVTGREQREKEIMNESKRGT